MDQIKILFVDVEEEYLMLLVMKFIEQIGDQADISMITDREHLNEYLNEPHEVDILIVKDTLYDKRFERFMINHTFFLTENEVSQDDAMESNHMIYKYSSIGHIFTKVASMTGLDQMNANRYLTNQVIMIYSPIGGSGKTYTSIGIARALGMLNKRVLYLNTESVQDFHYYLKEDTYASREFEQAFIRRSETLMESFMAAIHHEEFDYLPPLEQSTVALNLNVDSFRYLVGQLQELGLYDFIILETSKEFSYDTAAYMGFANKVLIVANQDEYSVMKLERFLGNIDYAQQDKFQIICNRYSSREENYFNHRGQEQGLKILEYIGREDEGTQTRTMDRYIEGGFQKIAYYLI